MERKYIIINTNSENSDIDFYIFRGTENQMKQKMFEMAKKAAIEIECNDEEMPKSIDDIKYDEAEGYWQIMLTSYEDQYDDVFTAKEVNKIQMLG